jgi:hypothetical protein
LIEQFKWRHPTRDEALSPFLRGNSERPLRITFHSSSFTGASNEDIEAIKTLRDFSTLSEMRAVDTEAGALPHLQIGSFKVENPEIPVTVLDQGHKTELSITQADHWAKVAAEFVGQTDPLHPDAQAVFRDLLVARAHNL